MAAPLVHPSSLQSSDTFERKFGVIVGESVCNTVGDIVGDTDGDTDGDTVGDTVASIVLFTDTTKCEVPEPDPQ